MSNQLQQLGGLNTYKSFTYKNGNVGCGQNITVVVSALLQLPNEYFFGRKIHENANSAQPKQGRFALKFLKYKLMILTDIVQQNFTQHFTKYRSGCVTQCEEFSSKHGCLFVFLLCLEIFIILRRIYNFKKNVNNIFKKLTKLVATFTMGSITFVIDNIVLCKNMY